MPVYVETSIPNLAADLGRLKAGGFRLVVIDTPPAVTAAITDVVAHADLVVVPTRPSPHDLRAVGATVDIVEAAGKPLVFVVNCATARAKITGETAVSLSQHGTVAPVTVHNRVDFAASMIDGRTVGEVNATSRSAKEIGTLWGYLQDRLRRLGPEAASRDVGKGPRFDVELLTPGPAATTRREEAPRPSRQPAPEPAAAPRAPRPVERPAAAAGTMAPQAPRGPVETPAAPQASRPAPQPVQQQDDSADIVHLKNGTQPTSRPADDVQRAAIWDGIDRRRQDAGPPSGMPDRRRAPIFGRRPTK